MQEEQSYTTTKETFGPKKNSKNQFDVSMGADDGAERCELVGLYILTEIHDNIDFTSVGLYRDDGLAVIRPASGSSLDRYRKKLITLFQDNELKTTVKTEKTSIHFLDINFCLNSEPYRKPNDEPLYINRNSNHPPAILSRLPQTISKRISSLSSNFELFSRAAPIYNAALENAGYTERVNYDSEINESKPPRNRKRNIIWYNPPYNSHSTETALLKVVNDLFLSLNKGNISVLALLDFSSAFDTIDHTILVHRLHTDFGFTDTVLQWFSSYLTDRTHYVSLCNHCSDFAPVHSGVPQGSVLGPILFTMYIKPLSAIIDSHSIIHHSFADDLQLQMSAPPDRISELLHSMQSCISDVKAWATVNMLRLNDSKTELMLVTSKRSKHLHNLPTSITIGNAQIPFKQSVKNLGFTLDCHLTMNAHVSNIARTCYFELRRLAYIRRFLTSTATATLVSAFVLSRIDYCNSLLFGSTLDVTSHLQRIQNYAARVILRLPMSSRITIHLKSLHWLPVKVRSTYKIACLCYHCHSSTAPSYVTDMLHKKPLHTRNTRSSSYTMPLLNRPAHSKATLGDRSFSFASSSVWNSIPNDVKCAPSLSSFKSRLKTYLFRSVYKD